MFVLCNSVNVDLKKKSYAYITTKYLCFKVSSDSTHRFQLRPSIQPLLVKVKSFLSMSQLLQTPPHWNQMSRGLVRSNQSKSIQRSPEDKLYTSILFVAQFPSIMNIALETTPWCSMEKKSLPLIFMLLKVCLFHFYFHLFFYFISFLSVIIMFVCLESDVLHLPFFIFVYLKTLFTL